MIKLDENTPLAIITVGQFLELIDQKVTKKEPEQSEELKDDRIGIEEVKEITRLSYSQLYKLTAKNEIPHRKFGKRLVFSRTAIKDWMEKQTNWKDYPKGKSRPEVSEISRKTH
jgi:excisionase family DNA binding protein